VHRCSILLLGLLGCGRIGFGGESRGSDRDGATGDSGNGASPDHDEDGDGIADAFDDCPSVADPMQVDSDADGVGDACDPNPSVAGEHIVFFDPFVGPRSEWTFTGATPTFSNDSLVVDVTAGGSLVGALSATPNQKDEYIFGAHILAVGASDQHLALGLGQDPLFPTQPPTGAYYRCELCAGGPCGGSPFYALTTTTNNVSFTHLQQSTAQPFQLLSFTFGFRQTIPSMTCSTTFPVNMPSLSGAVPGNITPVHAGFKVIGLEIALDYFIQIHTD